MGSSNDKIYKLYHLVLIIVSLVILRTSRVEARRRLADAKGPHFEFAMVSAFPSPGTRFFGGKATLSVWDPAVSRIKDSSSSSVQIVLSDDFFISAGWIVYPKRYGDFQPRLFVYWTKDNGEDTGCFDLDCDGFRLFTESSPIGQPIVPVSTVGASSRIVIDVLIHQVSTEDWILRVGDIPLGFWPASMFTGVPAGAEKISWGGEVFDSVGNDKHTDTDMGNGLFPDITTGPTGDASSVCNLEYVDGSNTLQSPDRDMLGLAVTNPLCYDAQLLPVTDTVNGVCFLFGGSGRNPGCP